MTERGSHALHLVGAAPPRLEVRLLGGFGIARDGQLVDLSGWQRRPAALLRLLAASGGRVTRDDVIERFWPDSDPEKGATNLRQVLYQIRRELGADPPPVIVDAGWVALNPALQWEIDLAAFEAAVGAAGDDPAALDAALERFAGEPLPEDRYEDWATPIREQVQRRYREAALRAARLHRDAGTTEHALKRLSALLDGDPLDEVALQLQLEVLAEAGRRADALKAYARFKERLAAELDLEPEPETAALVDEIGRGGRFRPARDPAATADAGATPHNLPAAMSSFVGRTEHVERLSALLARRDVRLLTLTGPGGTGKTRLALEVARASLADHPDGAFFVSLAPLADGALFVATVASALGMKESGSQPILETVKEALATKQALLVLDNFEHLLPAALQVSELLAACSRLTVLATSRERLHLYGEHEYRVPPLTLPGAGSADLAEAAESEAVALFVARAQAARQEFALTSGNVAAVTEICRRLDGLPLAIELAAARITLFAPEALLTRLDRRLAVAVGGPRDVTARQQTLHAAIDWSFSLLSQSEQTLFARLSVFAGGWTVEAAEAVCDPARELRLLAGIESLLQKSLLRLEDGVEGEPRFGMLETIREYAAERLESSDEEQRTRDQHTEYFLATAQEARARLRGQQRGVSLEWFEREHNNLSAALAWCLKQNQAERGLRLAVACVWEGHVTEGRRWLEEVLAMESADPLLQAQGLDRLGEVLTHHGNLQTAQTLHEEALQLRRQQGDARGIAYSLLYLGFIAWLRGEQNRSNALLEESLAVFRAVGDEDGVPEVLRHLAWNARQQGEYERARTYLREALPLARQRGLLLDLAYCLDALGVVEVEHGADRTAHGFLEEALELYRMLKEKEKAALCLNHLAWLAVLQGEDDRAVSLAEEAITICREREARAIALPAIHTLGVALWHKGDVEGARSAYVEALTLAGAMEYRILVTACLEGLAEIQAQSHHVVQAARLFGAAEALREEIGAPLTANERAAHDKIVATARAQLDEARWAEAWHEGRAMTFQEAIEYALRDRSP